MTDTTPAPQPGPAIDFRKMFELWYVTPGNEPPPRTPDGERYSNITQEREFRAFEGATQMFVTLLHGDQWHALNDAVHAMTDTLEYEWDGEFRKAIENLNTAHMRFRAQERRIAPRVIPLRRADVVSVGRDGYQRHFCLRYEGGNTCVVCGETR